MKYYCRNCGAEYTDGAYTPTRCFLCEDRTELLSIPDHETVAQEGKMKYYCRNCGAEYTDGVYTPTRCFLCEDRTELLSIPDHETVAQWEQRRKEKYPGTAPVYNLYECDLPYMQTHWIIAKHNECLDDNSIVATEAGTPPDDWRPE